VLADGLKEMGLAQARAGEEKERIIGFARRLGNGLGGGVSVVVIITHDEGFEGVFGLKASSRMAEELRSIGSGTGLALALASGADKPLAPAPAGLTWNLTFRFWPEACMRTSWIKPK